MGCTRRELMDRLGSDEYAEWLAYASLEPIWPHGTGEGKPIKPKQTEAEMKAALLSAFGVKRNAIRR